jgi:DsbC/DsbD-like thiol-disulfide interchange protein
MNRNLSMLLFLILLSLAAAGCSSGGTEKAANTSSAQQQNANAQATPAKALPEDVVVASADKVELQSGKPAQASVKLVIKDGYHINANPPSKYQIATQLTPAQSEGITASQPAYPPSITKKFKFSEQPLAVYEKEAVINLPLTAAATAPKGERSIQAQLRFQACDDEVCYAPKTLQVQIPVSVK